MIAFMPNAVTPISLRIFRKPGPSPSASSVPTAHPSPVTTDSIERTLQPEGGALPARAVRRAPHGLGVVGPAGEPRRGVGRLEPAGARRAVAACRHRGGDDAGRARMLLLLGPDRVRRL